MEIESWLHSIDKPDGSRLKIKGIMSTIFSHGVRWELVEHNPICGQGGTLGHRGASTGVRQSGKVSIKRIVLTPKVVQKVIENLRLREATMALLDAVTGLRASELIALKWKDVQWKIGTLRSERALSQGELKETKSCDNDLPLAKPIMEALRLWREHTPYRGEEDWIPPVRQSVLSRQDAVHVSDPLSQAHSAGDREDLWAQEQQGRSYWLAHPAEVIGDLVDLQWREREGHAVPTPSYHALTLRLYSQAVSADQQKAHAKVVQMVLPKAMSKKLKAKTQTAG